MKSWGQITRKDRHNVLQQNEQCIFQKGTSIKTTPKVKSRRLIQGDMQMAEKAGFTTQGITLTPNLKIAIVTIITILSFLIPQ